jgi:hypothetical protein
MSQTVKQWRLGCAQCPNEVPVTYNQTEVFVDPICLVIKTVASYGQRIVLQFSDGLRRTIPTGPKEYVQCNKILEKPSFMKNYILLTEINTPLCMSDYFIKLLCFRRLGTAVMLKKFRKKPRRNEGKFKCDSVHCTCV